ncbi:MAG: hypothetical protein LBE48_01930 [Methanomassiliicoccaceae archaeon]|nr:hypothetical protein [Methanomassiliicoccaceae archaeon]
MHRDDHDHEHEHDDDHEHNHDHEHDDDHEHDHDHEDDHGNPADEHDKLHLEIHRAVDELGKYAIDIDIMSAKGLSKDNVLKFIDDLMVTVTKSCMDNGADLVGHVKSFFSNDDGSIMSSIVDHRAPTRIKDSMSSDKIYKARFMLHIIVHGIWDDRVRESVLDVLDGIFQKWNVPYEVTADHSDVERSITHPS